MSDPEILVVGLGPVGAVLAGLLGRQGINVLVIERDTDVYPLPRAAHLDHEVMRLLGLVGAADAVLAASQPVKGYDFLTKDGDLLMGFRPPSDYAPTGFPWGNMFHQPTLEHAVRRYLETLPSVTVRLGVSLEAYEADKDGVSTHLTTPGGREHVRARYIVGCDGARSTVRRRAGIDIEDLGFDEPWLVVDVRLSDPDGRLDDVGKQHCDPARPTTSMPMGPGRHRWEFMLRPDEEPETMVTDHMVRRLIEPWADPASLTLERRAVYRFHGTFAKEWRKERALLIGDAAHQMPPFMGQGLCSGVRDAANLAWKLGAVLRRHGGEALLDTVQPEREPQVRFITVTAISMGRVVCTMDEAAAAARDAEMTAVPRQDRISPLPDLPGISCGVMDSVRAGSVLPADPHLEALPVYAPFLFLRDGDIAKGSGGAAVDRIVRSMPQTGVGALCNPGPGMVTIGDQDGFFSDLLGDNEALLAKPDRIVFGTGSIQAVGAAWQTYLGAVGDAPV